MSHRENADDPLSHHHDYESVMEKIHGTWRFDALEDALEQAKGRFATDLLLSRVNAERNKRKSRAQIRKNKK